MRSLVIFIILLSFTHLATQAQFIVTGKVNDAGTGEPLAGAHVMLANTYAATTTDFSGEFRLKGLKPGKHTIRVTYLGYRDEAREVNVESNMSLDFDLHYSPIMGEEVIITATRASARSPTTYTNVSKEDIEPVNLGQDLPYLIQNSPSVVITSDAGNGIGYTGIRIRGTDLTRINVTLDGVPLNNAESHGVWWVDLPDLSSSIDNIQIQRGVGTSTNGAAAFGASLNIQTQKQVSDAYGEINGSYGSFNTMKTTVKAGTGLIKQRWSFDARFSKINSDGYIDRAFADLTSFYATGGYYGQSTLIKAVVFTGTEQTYQAWDGVPSYILDTNRTYNGLGKYTDADGQVQYYDNQTDNYKQSHYQLFWAQEISHNWNFNMALYYTRGKGYYEEYKENEPFYKYGLDDVTIGDSVFTSTDLVRQRWLDNDFYGVNFAFNHDDHKRLNLNIGGSYSYYDGGHFGEIIWSEIAAGLGKDYRWYENTGRKNDFNMYTRANYQLSEKLNIYGDLQFRRIDYRINGIDNDLRDISQTHFYNFFNPKLGLYYEFDQGSKAFVSIAVGNREPNRSTLVDANPEKPYPVHETLTDFEAGYQFRSTRVSLAANLYFMKYKNQLVLTGMINDVGDPVMENVPDSYRTGAELAIGFNIRNNLNRNVNTTPSKNIIRNFISYTDNWNIWPEQITDTIGTTEIAFSPAWLLNSTLDYEPLKFLHLVLYSKYVGKQYIDNTSSNDRSLNAYFVNDLLIYYSLHPKFMKEIIFSLKVNNLFNAKYETNAWVYRYYYEGSHNVIDGYFPQAGINFMAGIALKF